MIRLVQHPDPPSVERFLWADLKGSLAFDVGGNTGQSVAQLTGKFDRIISFEPNPESYELLKQTPCEAVRMAVSDHTGNVVLESRSKAAALGQFTSEHQDMGFNHPWGEVEKQVTIPCISLDEAVREFGVPDFVKVDVEGHEVRVMHGAKRLLENHRPAWLVEIHFKDLGEEVGSILRHHGYKMHYIMHPHYAPQSTEWFNHYWIRAEMEVQ